MQAEAVFKNNPLTVWLALPSHLTSRGKVPVANIELRQKVQEYGKLGLLDIGSGSAVR